MRTLLIALMVLHGSIHSLGTAKALGWAEVSQLQAPITRAAGVLWLLAGLGFLLAAGLVAFRSNAWWLVGALAVVASQAAIVGAWSDARFGTLANVLIFLAVAVGFATTGPTSLRATWRDAVAQARIDAAASDLGPGGTERLPDAVRRYVDATGAEEGVGVRGFRARWRGRIRATPDDPWMEFVAEQYNTVEPPARFFLMDATRGGLPVQAYHEFRDGAASMVVRLLGVVPLVDLGGPEFTRAETVTLLNDLALLAPAALANPAVRWDAGGERYATARYTVGSHTVSARLEFDGQGLLADFVSDDRLRTSADGNTLVAERWSTPVLAYGRFGGRRLMSRGEGRWHPPEGAFAYVELELLEAEVDPAR